MLYFVFICFTSKSNNTSFHAESYLVINIVLLTLYAYPANQTEKKNCFDRWAFKILITEISLNVHNCSSFWTPEIAWEEKKYLSILYSLLIWTNSQIILMEQICIVEICWKWPALYVVMDKTYVSSAHCAL